MDRDQWIMVGVGAFLLWLLLKHSKSRSNGLPEEYVSPVVDDENDFPVYEDQILEDMRFGGKDRYLRGQ